MFYLNQIKFTFKKTNKKKHSYLKTKFFKKIKKISKNKTKQKHIPKKTTLNVLKAPSNLPTLTKTLPKQPPIPTNPKPP